MPRRKLETDAGGALGEAAAAWSRLNESQRMMFIAALLRELMSKPASQNELEFWIVTLQEQQAALVAGLVDTQAD